MKKGFSLLEVLVVLAVFSLIAIISTQTIVFTLRGARKSEATARVRQNVDYALSVIERSLHNATDVTCPNPSSDRLDYIDLNGTAASFRCFTGASDKYIASGSARLTSSEVNVTSCVISCTPGISGAGPSVTVSITAVDTQSASGVEGAKVTSSTQVFLRNF